MLLSLAGCLLSESWWDGSSVYHFHLLCNRSSEHETPRENNAENVYLGILGGVQQRYNHSALQDCERMLLLISPLWGLGEVLGNRKASKGKADN